MRAGVSVVDKPALYGTHCIVSSLFAQRVGHGYFQGSALCVKRADAGIVVGD